MTPAQPLDLFMSWKPIDSFKDRMSCPPVHFQRETTCKWRIVGTCFKSTEKGKKEGGYTVCIGLQTTKSLLFLSSGKATLGF